MNHFCTYCDHGYAGRLLCLHDSLREMREPFRLHVLCFDEKMEEVISARREPSLVAVRLEAMLRALPDYAAARARRTPIEFYFTTTPVLTRYCLDVDASISQITYLDSDLLFFQPPSAVFAEQADASVAIVPHRFPPRLQERSIYGIYNVAWVSFRRDGDGLACLDWWRERCLGWCHDRLDGERFADQGYLNEFPRRFQKVAVLEHPGINAAPWNIDGDQVAEGEGRVTVEGRPLLFYHFQGIRELAPGWFEPGLRAYGTPLTSKLRELIYVPYLKRLRRTQDHLQRVHGIAPRFVYQRLNSGDSVRHRWERFKACWVHPLYGRIQGRLIHATS